MLWKTKTLQTREAQPRMTRKVMKSIDKEGRVLLLKVRVYGKVEILEIFYKAHTKHFIIWVNRIN